MIELEEAIMEEDISYIDQSPDPETDLYIPHEKGCYIYPLVVTKWERSRHLNLPLTENNNVHHYSGIINFS